jgi:hypothetical protein
MLAGYHTIAVRHKKFPGLFVRVDSFLLPSVAPFLCDLLAGALHWTKFDAICSIVGPWASAGQLAIDSNLNAKISGREELSGLIKNFWPRPLDLDVGLSRSARLASRVRLELLLGDIGFFHGKAV